MEKYDVYKEIATRSNGDLYIGVVGPVRTGKSTFISRFMEGVVLPNISNKNSRERVKDELPQSADGKMVMTTEPKFVPNEGVNLSLDKNLDVKVRLIDCVGYLVDGAIANEEDGKSRMVSTPWHSDPMPFERASEIGTQKVILEHSNVGVVVTTDGSITDLPRTAYVQAEERVVGELKQIGKPFTVILNSSSPDGEFATALAMSLTEKYGVEVLPMNLSKMDKEGAGLVMNSLLMSFEVRKLNVELPKWMQALPYDDDMIFDIMRNVKENSKSILKMSDYEGVNIFEGSKYIENGTISVDASTGAITWVGKPDDTLFYQIISKQCNIDVNDDFELISALKELGSAKNEYDKIKVALDDVKEKGYGIVQPSLLEMKLEEPELVKQNGQFGVKLKASAPSMHIIKVDVDTEINPIVGTEQQGEQLVKSMLDNFQSNPSEIWDTNIFGKSLHVLVNDGLNSKIMQMPDDVKSKMRKTVGRIVNEGKGGVICILL